MGSVYFEALAAGRAASDAVIVWRRALGGDGDSDHDDDVDVDVLQIPMFGRSDERVLCPLWQSCALCPRLWHLWHVKFVQSLARWPGL